MNYHLNPVRISIITFCAILCLIIPSDLNIRINDNITFGLSGEPKFIEDLSECTTGLASGLATPDGCPLLWKNRDVRYEGQEYHYVDDMGIPFIGLTYETYDDQYYAGINEAGFAIENSDAHNLDGANPLSNGWGDGQNDGYTMALALATCRTVDDFQDILDSLNEDGRTFDFNYGTFDAFGGAAMFECDGYEYWRYDAADEEDGFLIRSNFAFSGDDTSGQDLSVGVHRHDRAYMLWKEAVDENRLTPHFVFQQVVRDLTTRECNPLPLPFDGYYDDGWPYGHVDQQTAINRSRTRSVFVGQGVPDGDRPEGAVIWAMCGSPLACVATPLWVHAGSVPEEYDADGGSRLWHRSDNLKQWVNELGFGVNTWRLANPAGTGVYDLILPLETYFFEKTERFVNSPHFTYDRLEAFQDEVAQQAIDSLDTWSPTYYVTEDFEAIYEANNLVLIWGDDDNGERFGGLSPRSYLVYRSDHPFREGESGELLACVDELRYVDTNPPAEGAFYKVELVY